MKMLKKAIIRRNDRVIQKNEEKIAQNEEIIKGVRRGRIKKARKAWGK